MTEAHDASPEHARDGAGSDPGPVTASVTFSGAIQAAEGDPWAVIAAAGLGENYERGHRWNLPDTDEGIGSLVRLIEGMAVHWHKDVRGSFDHAAASVPYWLRGQTAAHLHSGERAAGQARGRIRIHPEVPAEVGAMLRAGGVGLSIEAHCSRRFYETPEGEKLVDLYNFTHGSDAPASVAIVSNPALQGRIAASVSNEEPMNDDTKADEGKAPVPDITNDDLTARLEAATKKAEENAAKADEILAGLEKTKAKTALAESLRASKLPEKAQDGIAKMYDPLIEAGKVPTAEEIQASIDLQREILKDADALVVGEGAKITGGNDIARDHIKLRMLSIFLGGAPGYVRASIEKEDGKSIRQQRLEAGLPGGMEPSILRLFRDATGHEFTDLRNTTKSRAVRASIETGTWADAWADSLYRVFEATYRENPDFSDWRLVAKTVPIQNFVEQKRIVLGGYPNLSTVAEAANYTAITSPGDEKQGYTPAKRGNTEDVTWESFLRDDVGALAGLPSRLGLAAARTLYEFVMELYRDTTVTMDYDATRLYDATHNNRAGTLPLDDANLVAGLHAMRTQADISNAKRLGVMGRFLLVPIELEKAGFDLLKARDTFPGGSTDDYEYIRRQQVRQITVRHWTNATDWYLAADPFSFPTAEIGFVNGQEDPELFVQNNETVGSMFDADKITYKIRHAYGGTIMRHEGVYGSIAAV